MLMKLTTECDQRLGRKLETDSQSKMVLAQGTFHMNNIKVSFWTLNYFILRLVLKENTLRSCYITMKEGAPCLPV